jgi:hypothetical protein
LRHCQGKRLQISRDLQRASIDGFKAEVANQRRRDVFASRSFPHYRRLGRRVVVFSF